MFRMEEVLLVTPETEEEEIRLVNRFSTSGWFGIIRKTLIIPKDHIQEVKEFIEEEEKSNG